MASSLPVVATAVGEVPTIILDGRTGILVPPKNPEWLANAIVTLLRNPDEQERLGAAARKLIEDDFSAGRMTDDYLRVYELAASRRTSK
jgi:glycosyltransferase involved in cell wall biosynthesis